MSWRDLIPRFYRVSRCYCGRDLADENHVLWESLAEREDRIDAVLEIHRPLTNPIWHEDRICAECLDDSGAAIEWPCKIARALGIVS